MAISCKLNTGITKADVCGYSLPEIVDIYLANFDEVKTQLGTDDEITGVTGTFYKFEPAKNSASFEDTLVVNDNGSKYRTHTLTFTVNANYNGKIKQVLDTLSLGRFVAVVLTAEGQYLMLGRVTGLEAETATVSGGGDNAASGIQVVLSANVTESVSPLNEAAANTVTGAK